MSRPEDSNPLAEDRVRFCSGMYGSVSAESSSGRVVGDLVLSEPGAEPGSPARQPRWGGAATRSSGDEPLPVHHLSIGCNSTLLLGPRAPSPAFVECDSVRVERLSPHLSELAA